MYIFSQSKVPNYQRVYDNVDRDEVGQSYEDRFLCEIQSFVESTWPGLLVMLYHHRMMRLISVNLILH